MWIRNKAGIPLLDADGNMIRAKIKGCNTGKCSPLGNSTPSLRQERKDVTSNVNFS